MDHRPLARCRNSKYGVTKPLSIGDNYKNDWKALTGKNYKYNTADKNSLLTKFYALANTRDDCYIYTCKCHGDGSDDRITVNSLQSKGGNIEIVNYGKDYCKTMYREDSLTVEFRVCQTTAYFMQYLAQVAVDAASAVVNVPKKYESVKWSFAAYAVFGNMHSPHYQETYYLLSRRSQ